MHPLRICRSPWSASLPDCNTYSFFLPSLPNIPRPKSSSDSSRSILIRAGTAPWVLPISSSSCLQLQHRCWPCRDPTMASIPLSTSQHCWSIKNLPPKRLELHGRYNRPCHRPPFTKGTAFFFWWVVLCWRVLLCLPLWCLPLFCLHCKHWQWRLVLRHGNWTAGYLVGQPGWPCQGEHHPWAY